MPLFSEFRCAVTKEERRAVIVKRGGEKHQPAENNAGSLCRDDTKAMRRRRVAERKICRWEKDQST